MQKEQINLLSIIKACLRRARKQKTEIASNGDLFVYFFE